MAGLPLLVKAALPSVPGINQLPGVKKASASGFAGLSKDRPPVTVERAHVDAYAAVCGFPTKAPSRSPTRTCSRSRCTWRS